MAEPSGETGRTSPTIYLSSTYQDLQDHRRAVNDALRASGYTVIAMEDYVARDERPVAACLADVDRCDIYVGLFAFRYGYCPPPEHGNPDGLSITELEFRRADANPKVHCLTFLLDEKATWPLRQTDAFTGENGRGERIEALRAYLGREKMASFFTAPAELATKVQSAITKHLAKRGAGGASAADQPPPITWDIEQLGSPYPGLMHFTPRYAPVYFGREADVRAVLDRLHRPEGRFVIVSGDSGSGKSSLVDAGVVPKLCAGGLPGGRAAEVVRVVPSQGADPFDALLRALHNPAERAGLRPFNTARTLAQAPAGLPDTLADIIARGIEHDALVVFLDQMEELFSGAGEAGPDDHAGPFLAGLYRATQDHGLWVLATIRSDWLHRCYAHPDMLAVLRGAGHYPLGRVAGYMMRDMIVRPAECAGLTVSDALARRLIEDAGSEPGNLPLLAFVLERLFDRRQDGALSETVYVDELGGLTGALAGHAADVEAALTRKLGAPALEEGLPRVFESLVRVSVEGLPTRRRARREGIEDALRPIVEHLVQGRLLAAEGEGEASVISVAHERLFEAWPALARWVGAHQDDLRLLRQAELDAAEWRRQGYDLVHLWHPDRLARLQRVIGSLPVDRAGAEVRELAWPQGRLLERVAGAGLSHEERRTVGTYLAELGDPRSGVGVAPDGTPDIDWVAIPGGEVVLEDNAGRARVEAFHIARYPVTNAQFQAFVDAVDGYRDGERRWWQGMPADASNGPRESRWPEPSHPRVQVSWYEAVAFCRWLSRRLGLEVRLPTEFEWQQAATGGDPANEYPWGPEWDAMRCNTDEGGLNRTTAVGLYPAGASDQGVLDLAGNVWEWCLNEHEKPEHTSVEGNAWRVLRGGAWFFNLDSARVLPPRQRPRRPQLQHRLSGGVRVPHPL